MSDERWIDGTAIVITGDPDSAKEPQKWYVFELPRPWWVPRELWLDALPEPVVDRDPGDEDRCP